MVSSNAIKVILILATAWRTCRARAEAPGGPAEPGPVEANDLRCESLREPLGVDSRRPRLSWVLRSSRRGERQTAFQVLVACSADRLARDEGDLWDSGKTISDQSIHVEYAGKPLSSRQRCHWKVRIWDKDGTPSAWSAPSVWTMGLMEPGDWKARWVTFESEAGLAHPWFRRTFDLPSEPSRAEAYVNTPARYELYINGRKAEPHVLAPADHQHKKRFLYNVYDVSALLRKGRNCIALWTGPGWYQPRYGNPHRGPIVRAQLEVHTAGGVSVIGSDARWRAADSCISQIGGWGWNDMGGERWDAGKYIEDWNQVSLDESGWAAAVEVAAPEVEHSWQALPGSRLEAPIPPEKIYREADKWVVDFGTTLTGWMRLRLSSLTPGQTVTIDYADLDAARKHLAHVRNRDGFQTFNQADVYVAGNRTEDVFTSKFNQHAFRYAVIGGLAQAPSADDVRAMTVMTDLESAGQFRCSNELFNRIHEVTVNTYRSQIPCGVLGGGESREKLGYGDGGSFLSGMLYNLRSDAFFQKWLRDWCDGQRADGFLGHTAPEYYPAGGGPSWGGQASELVRRLDLYYGDRRAVAAAYPTLKKYLDHLESHTEGDILRYFNPYTPGKYQQWYFLGDWTPPGPAADKHGFVFESPEQREFFNNCYRVLLWEQLARYAEVLGEPGEAKRCRDRLAALRPLVHRTYFDVEKNTYRVTRQAYLTIALYSGIVPADLRPVIFRQLEDSIVREKNGHLDTGLQGTFMLLDLLIRENRNDLAALMMNQTTFPGWGFLIRERGVTTWPETWSGWGSQIIQVVGTPGSWFYEGLAGIRPDPDHPGFKHFVLRPAVVDSVDWVQCCYQSPYGRIASNWKRQSGKLQIEVTVPPNTTATVHVPAADPAGVTESGKGVARAEGVKRLRHEAGCVVCEIGAGNYVFKSGGAAL